MNWRYHLQNAWQELPPQMRKAFYGVLAFAVVLIVLSFVLPPDYQIWPVVILLALFLVLQVVILRQMWQQSPAVRLARQHYLAGDFAEAITVLEAARDANKPDVVRDTLLGNAYRQVGRLEDSVDVLAGAYELQPDKPFVAYGYGRTLLVTGRYEEAAALIAYALQKRGQPVIVADLAYAHYLAGQHDQALEALAQADALELEPYRKLMTLYLRWQLEGRPAAGGTLYKQLDRYEHGLGFWQAEVERFGDTPYGQALAADIQRITSIVTRDYVI